MEDLKVSEEYKKAYNQADMICTYMPHLLDSMHMPKDEPSEYTKGFEDRIKQFDKERDLIKDFPRSAYKEIGKDTDLDRDNQIDKD